VNILVVYGEQYMTNIYSQSSNEIFTFFFCWYTTKPI